MTSNALGLGAGLSIRRGAGCSPRRRHDLSSRGLARRGPAREQQRHHHLQPLRDGMRSRTVCLATELLEPLSGGGAVTALSAAAAALALGWALVAQDLLPQQDRLEGREPCPTCGGSGVELCFCHKWSDGDAGCNACGHTGYMECRSCGGGGTAVPLLSTVERKSNQRL